MNKARKILILFASLLFIFNLALVNFGDLKWSTNSGSYLGMIAMGCVIIAMIFSIKSSQK